MSTQSLEFPAGPAASKKPKEEIISTTHLGINCALSIAYLQCSELLWCSPPSPIKEQMYSEKDEKKRI